MRILLVDDEEQVLKGVSRIISCEEDEWEVETALSGEAALKVLEEEEYEVIVTDMRMPGMDGAQLLGEIGDKYPRMLRVILSGQSDRETVLTAVKPMHQFLSKPCDSEKLFEVIKRAEIFQQTIGSADVLAAISRADCLPSFPEIVNEINAEVDSDNSTSGSLAKIVSKDPILTARLLQLSNSAIFALSHPVTDIDRAISMVGLSTTRSLAMSQAVYSENESNDRILSAQSLLDHGLRVAVIGNQLAKLEKASTDDGNAVFAAGLLHDVGKLILLNAFPDRYEKVLVAAKSADCPLEELEMEEFQATHQGIGGYLFALWGLPSDVTEAVVSHHSLMASAFTPYQISICGKLDCKR